MFRSNASRMHNAVSTRKDCASRAWRTLVLAATLAGLGGCNGDEFWKAFRSGAAGQVQTGVETLILGVTDGLFSAINSGNDSSSSTTDSSGSANNTSAAGTDATGASADSTTSTTP